jgi:hypothetical protein
MRLLIIARGKITVAPNLPNIPDGLERRGQNAAAPGGTKMFLAEPNMLGWTLEFGISWTGTGDYAGGLNAGLLNSVFSSRFDNIGAYRMMYVKLFGKLLKYPAARHQ